MENQFVFLSFHWSDSIYDLIFVFIISILRGDILFDYFYGSLCLEIECNQLWPCYHAVTMQKTVYVCFHHACPLNCHYLWLAVWSQNIDIEGRHHDWLILWHPLSKNKMQSTLTMSCSYYAKTSLYMFPLCSAILALFMTWYSYSK